MQGVDDIALYILPPLPLSQTIARANLAILVHWSTNIQVSIKHALEIFNFLRQHLTL